MSLHTRSSKFGRLLPFVGAVALLALLLRSGDRPISQAGKADSERSEKSTPIAMEPEAAVPAVRSESSAAPEPQIVSIVVSADSDVEAAQALADALTKMAGIRQFAYRMTVLAEQDGRRLSEIVAEGRSDGDRVSYSRMKTASQGTEQAIEMAVRDGMIAFREEGGEWMLHEDFTGAAAQATAVAGQMPEIMRELLMANGRVRAAGEERIDGRPLRVVELSSEGEGPEPLGLAGAGVSRVSLDAENLLRRWVSEMTLRGGISVRVDMSLDEFGLSPDLSALPDEARELLGLAN